MDLGEEKLVFGIGTAVLMAVAWFVTSHFQSLGVSFGTLIGGLSGVYAIFCGGHVANKWIEGKQGAALTEQDLDLTEDDKAVANHAKNA